MTDGARKPPFQEPVFGASLPEKIREQENRDNTFTLKTSLFGQRNVILESDLTLLNVNRDIQKIHK